MRNQTTSKTGGLLSQTLTTVYPPNIGGSSKDAAFDTASSAFSSVKRMLMACAPHGLDALLSDIVLTENLAS
jgi:hypothetical protein